MAETGTNDIQRGLTMIRANFDEKQVKMLRETVRLLAAGEPVSVQTLADATGISPTEVEAGLEQRLSVERDEAGRIVGWGLTLRPTPHKISFNGGTFYGWCATDMLMFPVILGKSGIIESTDPITGRTVRIEVSPSEVLRVDPPEAVVTGIRPSERVEDVRTNVCGLGHFVSSGDAAAEWLAANPQGVVKPVADEFETYRKIAHELGWAAE